MGFYERVTMAFLEEDNAQRAFFRLRPLLNGAGPCTKEDLAVLPDEGYARIVPDKNEQANFKDRMRSLGSLCLIDLTPYPLEANKIRTNKNYAPDRGEKNQYILYSDVVHPLPETLVYEVVEAQTEDELHEMAARIATPMGYAKVAGQWYGPISRGQAASLAQEVPPQSKLHSVTFPDGRQRLFYWAEESAPAKEADPEMEASLNEASQALKAAEHRLFAMEPAAVPAAVMHAPVVQMPVRAAVPEEATLSGTPLYAGSLGRARLSRPRNPLHEVVDAQWRAAKYEAPSAQLQQGANLRHVENPMEHFRQAAEMVWSIPETQVQALDVLLNLPGMQKRLEKVLHADEPDSLLAASMRRQLQDLEAERLSLLIQLDKAKENKTALREEILSCAQQECVAKTKQLREETAALKSAKEAVRAQLKELTAQRDALQNICDGLAGTELPARLHAFAAGMQLLAATSPAPLYIQGAIGEKAAPSRMIASLKNAAAKQWGPSSQEDAVHILLLLALCPQIQLVHASLAEGVRFGCMCAQALGLGDAFAVQMNAEQKITAVATLGPAASPVIVATPFLSPAAKEDGTRTLLLSKTTAEHIDQTAYELSPWPVVFLAQSTVSFIADDMASDAALPAITLESLADMTQAAAELPPETVRWLDQLREVMADAGHPLPLTLGRTMAAYMKAAASLMQSGVSAAADYAFQAWILPRAFKDEKLLKALRPLLISLPRSGEIVKQHSKQAQA